MRYCCVPLCKSCPEKFGKESQDSHVSFHRLPTEPKLLKQFALRIRRDIGPSFRVTKKTVICSKHYNPEDFYIYNPKSGIRLLRPGVLPSIFPFKPAQKQRKPPAKRINTDEAICRQEALDLHEQEDFASIESEDENSDSAGTAPRLSPKPHLHHEETVDELLSVIEDMKKEKVLLMSDLSKERTARFIAENENKSLKTSLEEAQRDLASARCEIQKLKSCQMSFNVIKGNKSLLKLYTGMESVQEFQALFRYLDSGDHAENIIQWRGPQSTNLNALPRTRGRPPVMKAADQLLLVFCHLRLNLLEADLAHRFGVSLSTVSRVFASWINFMYFRLGYSSGLRKNTWRKQCLKNFEKLILPQQSSLMPQN